MEWSGLNVDTLLRRHVGYEPPPLAHHRALWSGQLIPNPSWDATLILHRHL